jgi:hypothetical protein
MITVWIAWACGGVLVGLFAALCARRRHAYALFVSGLLGLAALLYVYLIWSSDRSTTVNDQLFAAFWSLSALAIFAISPGFLFYAKRSGSEGLFLGVSFLSAIVAAPIWFYVGLLMSCALRLDCL